MQCAWNQRLSQRAVQPSFGRRIFSLSPGRRKISPDSTKFHCGRTPGPVPAQQKLGLPFTLSCLNSCLEHLQCTFVIYHIYVLVFDNSLSEQVHVVLMKLAPIKLHSNNLMYSS